MSATVDVQAKVAAGAEELAETEQLIDLSTPPLERRLSIQASAELVRERYSDAIRLLGQL